MHPFVARLVRRERNVSEPAGCLVRWNTVWVLGVHANLTAAMSGWSSGVAISRNSDQWLYLAERPRGGGAFEWTQHRYAMASCARSNSWLRQRCGRDGTRVYATVRTQHLTSCIANHTVQNTLGFSPVDRTWLGWSKYMVVWRCRPQRQWAQAVTVRNFAMLPLPRRY